MEAAMEKIVHRDNMNLAYLKIRQNKGSYGVDKMTIEDTEKYLKTHWYEIKDKLIEGTYKPKPVRKVEIPKESGGVRTLGIPTVIDRIIQQGIVQIIQPVFEEIFSENSYGFRPKRSTHDAIKQAKREIASGKRIIIDVDLEKFFDRVNHDKLMAKVAKQIKDKRLLKLIRNYLKSGIMENGIKVENKEGTPQGGPLSPLLSNIMLDELDKELERRKLSYVRYADDIAIFVKSPRAGERVLKGITKYIETKLKLKVNKEKSKVEEFF